MKKYLIAAFTFICLGASLSLVSCSEVGMDDPNLFYSYSSHSDDFKYQEACGPFDAAIRAAVGKDPILGGDDDKVIKACDECYENLKSKLQGKSGKVIIYKTRHPDGKQMDLKKYKF